MTNVGPGEAALAVEAARLKDAVKACPFCGDTLEFYDGAPGLPTGYAHADDGCFMGDVFLSPGDVEAWNRRAGAK
jgi:hypothetical protein